MAWKISKATNLLNPCTTRRRQHHIHGKQDVDEEVATTSCDECRGSGRENDSDLGVPTVSALSSRKRRLHDTKHTMMRRTSEPRTILSDLCGGVESYEKRCGWRRCGEEQRGVGWRAELVVCGGVLEAPGPHVASGGCGPACAEQWLGSDVNRVAADPVPQTRDVARQDASVA